MPPTGGAAPRANTLPPAFASSSEGKAPAAHGSVNNSVAQNEQAARANTNGAQQIECASDPETMARIKVKKEMALVTIGGLLGEHSTKLAAERSAKEDTVEDQAYFGERVGTVSAHKGTGSEMKVKKGVVEGSKEVWRGKFTDRRDLQA